MEPSQQPRTGFARRPISRWPVAVLLGGLGLAAGLVMLGAALAAAPAQPPPIERPGTANAPRDVNVILRDHRFDPTPLHLVAGETVRLRVVNGGLVEHELVLGDQSVQLAWSRADAAVSPPAPFTTSPPASVPAGTGGVRVLLASGAATTVIYEVPRDGQLALICHLPGHAERGMVGQVVRDSR